MIPDAPAIDLTSTRGTILLWVTTDAPGTWTSRSIIEELSDMGTPARRAFDAITALRQRGLLRPGKTRARDQDTLQPTRAGFDAVRVHVPGWRVGAA